MTDLEKISKLVLSDILLYAPLYTEIVSKVMSIMCNDPSDVMYWNWVLDTPYPSINGEVEENVELWCITSDTSVISTRTFKSDSLYISKKGILITSLTYPEKYKMPIMIDTIFNYDYVVMYIRNHKLNLILSSEDDGLKKNFSEYKRASDTHRLSII